MPGDEAQPEQNRATWRPPVAHVDSTQASPTSGGRLDKAAKAKRSLGPSDSKGTTRQKTSALGQSEAAARSARQAQQETGSPVVKAFADAEDEEDESMEEEEADKPKKRKHRGGRRRTEKKNKEIATKDKGLIELLLLISKLLAQTAQKTRIVSAAALRTIVAPTTSALVKALDLEGNSYASQAAGLKSQLQAAKAARASAAETDIADAEQKLATDQAALHLNGPPAASNFVALLEACLPAATSIQQARLRAVLDKFAEAPPKIDICRLESCATPDLKIIVFFYADAEVTQLLLDAAARVQGAYVPRGAPPAGAMEEQLSDWISTLTLKTK